MRRSRLLTRPAPPLLLGLLLTAGLALLSAVAGFADLPDGTVTLDQVMRGRQLVLHHDCGGCHGPNTAGVSGPNWLAGFIKERDEGNGLPFEVGPKNYPFQGGSFKTYPRNLTPDNLTGLGRISARQIFNALRFGLKPGDTPELVITSNVPGQGNFPAVPKYLAVPMPWPAWRHMTDAELWAIAAYLKHGIKPVANKVPDSQGPPDFWAETYSPAFIGLHPAPAYPLGNEEFRP